MWLSHSLSVSNLIDSIHSNNICLYPFTIDHLVGGLLGFFAHWFIFHPSKSILPAPPHSLLQTRLLACMHPTSHHIDRHSLPTKQALIKSTHQPTPRLANNPPSEWQMDNKQHFNPRSYNGMGHSMSCLEPFHHPFYLLIMYSVL
jgi:hypothetical protein